MEYYKASRFWGSDACAMQPGNFCGVPICPLSHPSIYSYSEAYAYHLLCTAEYLLSFLTYWRVSKLTSTAGTSASAFLQMLTYLGFVISSETPVQIHLYCPYKHTMCSECMHGLSRWYLNLFLHHGTRFICEVTFLLLLFFYHNCLISITGLCFTFSYSVWIILKCYFGFIWFVLLPAFYVSLPISWLCRLTLTKL